jgi:hypothetical protein
VRQEFVCVDMQIDQLPWRQIAPIERPSACGEANVFRKLFERPRTVPVPLDAQKPVEEARIDHGDVVGLEAQMDAEQQCASSADPDRVRR